tara:strand:+ start:191 stop:421 length:231 start_codon:yes stop_codon:yes gene_type:complete
MYLLGLGLLVLSTWYLLRLFNNFNNDPQAKEEIDQVWKEAKKEAKNKNPFLPGRITGAFKNYNAEIKKNGLKADKK